MGRFLAFGFVVFASAVAVTANAVAGVIVTTPVPEPSTLASIAGGIGVLAAARFARRK